MKKSISLFVKKSIDFLKDLFTSFKQLFVKLITVTVIFLTEKVYLSNSNAKILQYTNNIKLFKLIVYTTILFYDYSKLIVIL